MSFVLLLGGARSGKSDRAARLALDSGMRVTFIATATAGDDEMSERISRHRSARPAAWSTVEAPLDLVAAVVATPVDQFVVVDCLTLWVSNLLGAGVAADDILRRAEKVAGELATRQGVVVTNEVGLGIVPANELARTFRDVLGGVNAAFARCAERSVLMVAGRTLDLT
jgi:adenosyl cobinamide kinase/adenosyl cobinamide phosphate guanylyltransferase